MHRNAKLAKHSDTIRASSSKSNQRKQSNSDCRAKKEFITLMCIHPESDLAVERCFVVKSWPLANIQNSH